MSVTPGPQFGPPKEAPTLSEITTTTESNHPGDPYSTLIPSRKHKYLARTGEKVQESVYTWRRTASEYPKGVELTVNGPIMRKYSEANDDDPGALFSYTPATVLSLHATQGEQGLAPSLLALAHKDMKEKYGVNLETPSDSLSPHSQRLAKKLSEKGLSDPWSGYDPNDTDFDDSKAQMVDLAEDYDGLNMSRNKEQSSSTAAATSTDRALPQRPLGEALAEGREHLRGLLRGPKEVPVVPRLPQGTQERLF